MKLTGKCKEDFEKWLEKTHQVLVTDECLNYLFFNELTDSMKYGVYVDFFDSVGISLQIYATDYNKWFINILQKGRYLTAFKEICKTRQEARVKAIEKANEIYNKL